MLKKITFMAFCLVFCCGCPNVNPKLNMPIQNQNGKLEEIKNNQNGVLTEIGKLRQASEIMNSQLKEVQQGLFNLNAAISKNENSGIQILQGDGALIMVFSLILFGMIFYYRSKAGQNEKTAKILADEIARFNNPILNDNVLRASMHTNSEAKVYKLLTKR